MGGINYLDTLPSWSELQPRISNTDRPHTYKAEHIAAIILWQALELPIKECQIVGQQGLVCVVKFEPEGYSDPIAPVVLADLGSAYLAAYRRFLEALLEWTPSVQHGEWSKRANAAAHAVVAHIGRSGLPQDDKRYFCYHLLRACAMPRAHTRHLHTEHWSQYAE